MEFKILEFNFLFDFNINDIFILSIENKKKFRNICFNLLNNLNDYDKFILTKNHCNKLETSKYIDVINNIFNLDINKIFLNRLYKNLIQYNNEFLLDKKIKLSTIINEYILDISSDYNYDFSMTSDINLLDILKSVDLKICIESDLLDIILNYLKLSNELYNYDIFIFFNIKQIFSTTEIEEIYKFCRYNKLKLILIESSLSYKNLDYEKHYIIDNDLCEIY